MTSTNLNKIVRNNFPIKPWILSKNTSEIVSSYVQKIYKNPPPNVSNAAPKPENKGPLRALKARTMGETNVALKHRGNMPNLNEDDLLHAVLANHRRKTAVGSLAAGKKLLKSPNYKIYSSRRFGSSASSSSVSIFKRLENRRQTRASPAFIPMRNLTVAARRMEFSPGLVKYLTPARNQHMESYKPEQPLALEVTSAIQRDLMVIDNVLKNRISLRPPPPKVEKKRPTHSMDGWYHPPSPDSLFLVRFGEREVANAELQEQYRRLKLANKQKHAKYKQNLIGNTANKRTGSQMLAEMTKAMEREKPKHRESTTRNSGSPTQDLPYSRPSSPRKGPPVPPKLRPKPAPSQVQLQAQLQAKSQAMTNALLPKLSQRRSRSMPPLEYPSRKARLVTLAQARHKEQGQAKEDKAVFADDKMVDEKGAREETHSSHTAVSLVATTASIPYNNGSRYSRGIYMRRY